MADVMKRITRLCLRRDDIGKGIRRQLSTLTYLSDDPFTILYIIQEAKDPRDSTFSLQIRFTVINYKYTADPNSEYGMMLNTEGLERVQ